MKRIVITGSSRGIGYNLAKFFLDNGHQVVISGSSVKSTMKAINTLEIHYQGQVFSKECDVRDSRQVELLGDFALKVMGKVDIWINNAGINYSSPASYSMDEEMVHKVIDVNIHGMINGSKTAVTIFRNQGFGALYNMEGLGSDGRIAPGQSIYGGTKRFLRYYTRALVNEAKDQTYIVARISPGMVTTELLTKDLDNMKDSEKARRIFSILADHVTTVAPWLGEKILDNKKNGVLIAWLTTPKIIFRFMTAKFIKRNPFD